MPGGSSLDAIPQIREASPGMQIVVLTMQNEPAFARDAASVIRDGALSFSAGASDRRAQQRAAG